MYIPNWIFLFGMFLLVRKSLIQDARKSNNSSPGPSLLASGTT